MLTVACPLPPADYKSERNSLTLPVHRGSGGFRNSVADEYRALYRNFVEDDAGRHNVTTHVSGHIIIVTPSDRPDWHNRAMSKLQSLSLLEDNWDDAGAESPNDFALQKAGEAIEILSKHGFSEPRIMPSVEDGIAITYRSGKKSGTIEFYNTEEICAVVSTGVGKPFAWQVDPNQADDIEASLTRIHQFVYE